MHICFVHIVVFFARCYTDGYLDDHNSTLLGLSEYMASELGTKPLLRNRHHLVSCREALWSVLTSLFLTCNICILFILGNALQYQYDFRE